MDQHLKPCPFCGGVAWASPFYANYEYFAMIACKDCKAQGAPVDGGDAISLAVENAIKAWNRRTP